VIEENDLTPDLLLQAPGGLKFGEEESLGENPAGLLAKTDDRGIAHCVDDS
jgi:hypothetical protein